MNMFRELRADEIECRIAQIKKTQNGPGLSLLLYKDARCDQNILDETVGPMYWQRKHTRDNANCIVSIWSRDLNQWIEKEDTGTESNTEKEKGLASDSFKRACFNWGIGRELYTAPFIWITADKCGIKEKDGKLFCYDRFTVKNISYKNGSICGVQIKNQATGKVCFNWGEITEADTPEKPEQPDTEEAPEVKKDAPADVQKQNTLPSEAQKPAEKAGEENPEYNPVQQFLLTAMKGLREERGISADQNNKLFKKQKEALIKAGMAPNKALNEYTLEEAEALIDAMYKNFSPEGTEVK